METKCKFGIAIDLRKVSEPLEGRKVFRYIQRKELFQKCRKLYFKNE